MEFTHQLKDNVLIINFIGSLMELLRTEPLLDMIDQHIAQGILKCAINLENLNFINSTGISTLIVILTRFRNKGGEVLLAKPSEHIQKLLIMTKLQSMFTIAPDVDTGIRMLNGNA
ncbi:MAG: STAS domain-containing protein [Microscillaceae bacterium]|nr:STAS domain-containing protein [Microscillaceae bacterium]MDW8460792.1 STAS domain-containing protein [Cytophagales bacterium]